MEPSHGGGPVKSLRGEGCMKIARSSVLKQAYLSQKVLHIKCILLMVSLSLFTTQCHVGLIEFKILQSLMIL